MTPAISYATRSLLIPNNTVFVTRLSLSNPPNPVMAQSSLCLMLLFSAFTIASALPNPQPSSSDLECSEVDRQCYSDECKISRCRVKELCYDKRLDTWLYRHRNVITCESLECLNGGTPILPYQVKNFLFCCQLEVYRRVDVHSSGAIARPE